MENKKLDRLTNELFEQLMAAIHEWLLENKAELSDEEFSSLFNCISSANIGILSHFIQNGCPGEIRSQIIDNVSNAIKISCEIWSKRNLSENTNYPLH